MLKIFKALSDFNSNFVLGPVCLVGRDFIDTKSKQKKRKLISNFMLQLSRVGEN